MKYVLHRVGVSCGILMVLLCHSAFSAVLVQEDTFNGTPNYSKNITFYQWNSDWGVLNSILIEMEMSANGGALRVDNDSGSSSSSTVEFGAEGNISSSDVVLLNAGYGSIFVDEVVAATSDSMTLLGDDGDVEVGGTSNFSTQGSDYGSIVANNASGSGSDYVGNLFWNAGDAGFLGSGTYVIQVELDQYVNLGTISGAQQQIDPLMASGLLRMTYDFTGDGPPEPVPEPATLSLSFIAFLLLCAVRRKRF